MRLVHSVEILDLGAIPDGRALRITGFGPADGRFALVVTGDGDVAFDTDLEERGFRVIVPE